MVRASAQRARRVVAVAMLPVLASACVADPPPPRAPGEAPNQSVAISDDAVNVVVPNLAPGLNPHLRADMGTETDLLAALTLPSAYIAQPDGSYLRNADLVESVTVVSDSPFTLRYVLNAKSQWSDGVPIGAEDFRYLWQQLSITPGATGGAAGYRYITDIRAGAGGKTIDVEFDRHYPRWRELFANLLPAHLMNDGAPTFANVLAQGTPASGGPFKIGSADLGIGTIVLVRNDRYWKQPAQAEQVVIREAANPATLGQSARAESADIVVMDDVDVNNLVIDTVGGFHDVPSRSASQLTLTWNTTAPGLDSAALRRALREFIDPRSVGEIVTGDPNTEVVPFPRSEVRTPPAADRQAGEEALRELGFHFDGTRWLRDNVPLDVTIGVQTGDTRTLLAAATVADQLKSAGIDARAWELDADELYSGALPYGVVQAVLTWSSTVDDPLSAANARFRCIPDTAALPPNFQAGDGPGEENIIPDLPFVNGASGSDSGPPIPPPATVTTLNLPPDVARAMARRAGQGSDPAAPTLALPVPRGPNGELLPPPARVTNLSGFCDPEVDAALDAADTVQAERATSAPGAADTGPNPVPVDNSQPLAEDLAATLQTAAIDVPLVAPRHQVALHSSLRGFTAAPAPPGVVPSDRDFFLQPREWSVS